jgi:hypothetical protein
MLMHDRLTLDGPRRDSAGNLVASVLASRTGCQDYAGYEVGKPELTRVTVYRPASEVFKTDSMRSFAGAPVTIDHPSEPVTPANWKDHAVGEVASDDIVKDGDAVRVPFLLRDAAGIEAVEAGKREVSMGYDCSLEWGDGVAPDGTAYQATQRSIRINHLAIVDRARGGPTLRIGDQEKPTMKTMLIDGLTVDIANADTAEATIKTILAARDAATGKVTTLEAKAVEDAATIVAKDAEIVKLTADVAAAKLTPQQMRDAGKAYAATVAKARAAGVAVTDEMDEAAIKKAVVDKAMPSNTYTADHVAIAFDALTKDTKVEDSNVVPIGEPAIIGDAATKETAALTKANDHNAWRNAASA